MNTKIVGTIIAVAIVVGGAGFWGGTMYAQSNPPAGGTIRGGQFAQTGQNGAGGVRGGFRAGGANAVFGTVISKDADSITVQLAAGLGATSTNGTASGTRIVLYNTSTQIAKTISGSAADLAVGTNVTANGTANSDGSITAQMIQIRPAGTSLGGQRNQ